MRDARRIRKTYAYKTNDTVALFHKICRIVYIGCGTNFMFDNLELPGIFIKVFNKVTKVFELIIVALILSEWGAFFTQKNLDFLQKTNLYLYGPSSITLYMMYLNAVFRKEEIKELGFTLAVTLRGMFSVRDIERAMITKTWRFVMIMSFVAYGLVVSTGIVYGHAALTTNATFSTMVPVWPALDDRRPVAGVCRVAHYAAWWIFVIRACSMYFPILTITISLQHQFAILHEYFLSLNSVFEEDGSQEEKERRYEEAVKLGIKMHSLTLWCTERTQVTCGLAFSTQVITNVHSLVLLMIQWMHMEHTFGNVLNIVLFAGAMLIGTGVFMWNAGDITFEAAKLPTAMFHSGWYNCRGESSVRVRKLVTIAIKRAQIVKSSYSVFSVMYCNDYM